MSKMIPCEWKGEDLTVWGAMVGYVLRDPTTGTWDAVAFPDEEFMQAPEPFPTEALAREWVEQALGVVIKTEPADSHDMHAGRFSGYKRQKP